SGERRGGSEADGDALRLRGESALEAVVGVGEAGADGEAAREDDGDEADADHGGGTCPGTLDVGAGAEGGTRETADPASDGGDGVDLRVEGEPREDRLASAETVFDEAERDLGEDERGGEARHEEAGRAELDAEVGLREDEDRPVPEVDGVRPLA